MNHDFLIVSRVIPSLVSFNTIVCIFRVPHNSIVADRQVEVWVPKEKFDELGKEEVLKRLYKVFWEYLSDPEQDGKSCLIPVSTIIPELENNIELVMRFKAIAAGAASESEEDENNDATETSDVPTTEEKSE